MSDGRALGSLKVVKRQEIKSTGIAYPTWGVLAKKKIKK
jgi:hypothetical protein